MTIYNGDALEIFPQLGVTIDAIITDPPYFKVKNEQWDRQWDTAQGFLAWIDKALEQFYRLLANNGSLYVFASPRMSARVEVLIGERFNVLNNIRWVKDNGWHKKMNEEILRSWLSPYESIIFAEHYGADNIAKGEAGYAAKCDELRGFVFEPLRKYLRDEWERAGLNSDDANIACGTASMAGRHYFVRSQWCLPTLEHYTNLQKYANRNGGKYLRREYEDLRREYEDLRREYEDLRREYEDLRRPFSVTADVPYTNVWTFPTVSAYQGKHPCEKPLAMMEHIVKASTRPNAIILDPFMGSGTTIKAAQRLGRKAIGIELSQHWCDVAISNIDQPSLFSIVKPSPPAPQPQQLALDTGNSGGGEA